MINKAYHKLIIFAQCFHQTRLNLSGRRQPASEANMSKDNQEHRLANFRQIIKSVGGLVPVFLINYACFLFINHLISVIRDAFCIAVDNGDR